MRVRFERSGGFAGITLAHDFDSSSLPAEQTAELTRLVSEARFFELPAVIPASQSSADLFQYAITIDTGTQKHSIAFDQKSAPEHLQPLLKWLTSAQRDAIQKQRSS